MNLYEGMFLLNAVEAKRDWEGLSGYVKETLTKHGGEILKEEHWEDRKLAYEIAGQKRGTYLLIFFKLDPLKIAGLRRDFQLSERVLRQLFIRHQGDEVPEYASPAREYTERTFRRSPQSADERKEPAASKEKTPEDTTAGPVRRGGQAAEVESEPASDEEASAPDAGIWTADDEEKES